MTTWPVPATNRALRDKIALGRRIVAAILIAVALVACSTGNAKLQERVAFWRGALANGVPVGTGKEKIREWGETHHVKFDLLGQQHVLYANVERIPEAGIPFPCSEWNIILKITIDSAGRSERSEVSTAGSCI
jgi:hypothetical protein